MNKKLILVLFLFGIMISIPLIYIYRQYGGFNDIPHYDLMMWDFLLDYLLLAFLMFIGILAGFSKPDEKEDVGLLARDIAFIRKWLNWLIEAFDLEALAHEEAPDAEPAQNGAPHEEAPEAEPSQEEPLAVEVPEELTEEIVEEEAPAEEPAAEAGTVEYPKIWDKKEFE